MLRVDRPSFEYFKSQEPKLWKKKREKSNNKNEMTILRLVLVVCRLSTWARTTQTAPLSKSARLSTTSKVLSLGILCIYMLYSH